MNPRIAKGLQIAAIAVIVGLLALFVRSMDWAELARALRHAALWPLVASSAIYFACLFGKALSWRIMLEPAHTVPMSRLYRYTIAAFAASALTPARTGELVRVWALKRREGVPVSEGTAVALAEKLLLAITLLVIVAPVPWLLPRLPDWVANTMLMCAGIALGVLAALFLAVGRVEIREGSSWFARFIGGMHVVRDPKRIALALGTLLLTWIADLAAVLLVLHAVGIDMPIAGAMFILFTFNLAVAIPSTPAGVGALQVGALVATTLLGVPREPALAFALLYQAMQILPLLLVAFTLELDLVRGRKRRNAHQRAA